MIVHEATGYRHDRAERRLPLRTREAETPCSAASASDGSAACPTCHNPIFWRSAYGKNFCANCQPPKIFAMAVSWWVVVMPEPGRLAWEQIDAGWIKKFLTVQKSK